MKSFIKLKSNLKKDTTSLVKVRVALLADSSTQILTEAIIGTGIDKDILFEMPDLGHNQIDIQINYTNSELYNFSPEFVIFHYSYSTVLKEFYLSQNKSEFAIKFIQKIKDFNYLLGKNLDSKIIFFNIPEMNDFSTGSFGTQVEDSFIHQIRNINTCIAEIAGESDNFYIFDFNSYVLRFGFDKIFDPKLILSSDITISIESLPYISSGIVDIILASRGKIKKCIILDLDNTLWGGIIGDDGIENIEIGNLGKGKAFSELQLWLKHLNENGIILAICSKNEENIVLEVLDSHPEMILKRDNFAIIKANWDSKVENINKIQSFLNISFDSMIFIDDNPVERELVKEYIPEICTPDLPEDCALYTRYIQSLNLFETISNSSNDSARTAQYQQQGKRHESRKEFQNENDFLKSLKMKSKVYFDNENPGFILPRLAQLSHRTNQFNLTTIRLTEKDFQSIISNSNKGFIAFDLEDKFGTYGLISNINFSITKSELFIDNWVMSCRVFGRGLENFILNTLVKYANAKGINNISGEYIKSNKNKPVEDLFKRLGFKNKDNKWHLDLSDHKNITTFITSE